MVDGSTMHIGVKFLMDLNLGKGGFISESFSLCHQSHKKVAKSLSCG